MTTKLLIDRELLEQLHPYVYGPERVKLQQEVKALLSAQSPAGVDGLEVRAYEDSGGALYTAKLLEIMEVDSVGCEPLCRLSDAQRAIAKLKGEYEWVTSINTALDESNQRAWAS